MSYAVYRMFDKDGKLLYIGMSANFGERLKVHSATTPWFSLVAFIKITRYEDITSCRAAEIDAIILEQPQWNRKLKARKPRRIQVVTV